MAGAIFLLYLFVSINAGFALKCYKCNSQTIDGCSKNSPQLQETTCSLEHPDFNQFCLLKVVYDEQLKKDNILSGCEITSKSTVLNKNITQCQTDSRYQVKDCIVCDRELCNYTNVASKRSISILSVAAMCVFLKLLIS